MGKRKKRRTKVWGDISRFRVRGEMWKQSKKSLQEGKKDLEWKRRYLTIYVIVQGDKKSVNSEILHKIKHLFLVSHFWQNIYETLDFFYRQSNKPFKKNRENIFY